MTLCVKPYPFIFLVKVRDDLVEVCHFSDLPRNILSIGLDPFFIGAIIFKDKHCLWVFGLDSGYFFKHVAVHNGNSNIVFPISDVVFKVHGVGVPLDQHIETCNRVINLPSLTVVNHKHNEIPSQSLLNSIDFMLMD